jgi:hypothetical protein
MNTYIYIYIRKRKKLRDDLKDRRGYSHLKEEALDRIMWRKLFGGGFEPVVRQNTEWMNKYCTYLPLLTIKKRFSYWILYVNELIIGLCLIRLYES